MHVIWIILQKEGSWFRIINSETGEILPEKVSTEIGDEIEQYKFQGKSNLVDFLKNRSGVFNWIYKQGLMNE